MEDLIKCKGCGEDMHPYFYCGTHKSRRNKVFCSRGCQSRYNAMEYTKTHPATAETKKAKSEYDAKYREANRDKRIVAGRKYYQTVGAATIAKRQQSRSAMAVLRWGMALRSAEVQLAIADQPKDADAKTI